jgi:hypothetical protein
MEILGGVAATAQLIGLVVNIIQSIAELDDFISHVPQQYHRWHAQLTVLSDTIAGIQNNAALQTSHICRLVESINQKIDDLLLLCRQYTPRSETNAFSKVFKVLSARTVEPRMLQKFQALEHDKTTLLLAITTSVDPFHPTTDDMFGTSSGKVRRSATEALSDSYGA